MGDKLRGPGVLPTFLWAETGSYGNRGAETGVNMRKPGQRIEPGRFQIPPSPPDETPADPL